MKINNLFYISTCSSCMSEARILTFVYQLCYWFENILLMDNKLNNYGMKLATNPMQILNAFLNT